MLISSYIKPAIHRVPEFWSEERVNYVRHCATYGVPPYVVEEKPSRYGRILDRLVFKDLKKSDVEEGLRKADMLDMDLSVRFGEYYIDVPIYIGDMSFGALSGNPNIAIAKAVDIVGAVAGIGEGGLHPEVAKQRNIVIQWASARFGVDVDMLRSGIGVSIKIGQGAKPGIGGHLPGRKVVPLIAQLRKIPPGSEAISPAPHHDIYSIEDLAQRVKALRLITGKPVLVKVAAVNKISFIALGVARSTAAGIVIDGAGAGTGATPIVARDNLGIPIDYATPVVDQWLRSDGTRDGFLIISGGMLYSASDIAKMLALGANMVNLGTAALLAMGCIMCHTCHVGNCPTALTNMIGFNKILDIEWGTQRLVSYIQALTRGLKAILYALGMTSIRELIGRRDLLEAHHIDGKVGEVLGIDVAEEGETAWIDSSVHASYTAELLKGEPPIIGMGGVMPGLTRPARRMLDVLRIEAAQVTHPSVDPYREDLTVHTRVNGTYLDMPIVVPPIDRAAASAGFGLGALIDGDDCKFGEYCLNRYSPMRVSPGTAAFTYGGVIVIDERMGGSTSLEEAVSRLDFELRRAGARDRVVIIAAGSFYTGADIYRLAALGADLVEPYGAFEDTYMKVRNLDHVQRRDRYEKLMLALVKELKLLMGAGGITDFHHMVGNRDLLRSLSGNVARLLGVKVAGE